MSVIGVDPGQTGAIAWLNDDGTFQRVIDMPVDVGVSPALLAAAMRSHVSGPVRAAVVEKVGAMPQQGVASTFKFGVGYGVVLGVIATLHVPVHDVTPAKWKNDMRLTKDKGVSRRRACQLWPAHADLFARVKDDGRAEACLIARWWIDHGSRA